MYIYSFVKINDLISFGTEYWLVGLFAILIAAIAIVGLLYLKNKASKRLSKVQRIILMALRFLSFSLIAFMLLSPFFKSLKKITQQPIVIAAWDNSSSIVSVGDSLALKNMLLDIKSNISDEIKKNFDFVNYTFGADVTKAENLTFNEKKSNYAKLISAINNKHFNQNIGALLLIGDGIYNEGKNPLNLLSEINFPIYTIAVGDTSIVADSRVENIQVNRTAFLGNKFPVEVNLSFSKVKGIPLKVSILKNRKELQSVIVTPPSNNYFYSKAFILEADEVGLKHFSVKVDRVKNERNIRNNHFRFVINILENKQKILILSDGVHPDIGAIKHTLEEQKNYEVSVFTDAPYPANLKDYNLLIINQMPSAEKSAAKIIESAKKKRLPILFIVGNKTFLPQLTTLNQGVKFELLANSSENAQATYNSSYASFKLSEDFIELLPKLPPLQVAFANYSLDKDFTPLFYQKLKGIETSKPLVATGKQDGIKTGYILGEGIWRWRLFDYYQNQTHTHFNEFVNQLIQYLALRENEDNFIVSYKTIFAETDNVILNAEVYNDSFEPVESEEVNITLKNSNNEKLEFTFDTSGKNYYLNAGHLRTGDYTFLAKVLIGEEEFTETGSFTITPVNIENMITRAKHNMLYQLSELSGGKYYLANQTNNLLEELSNSNKLKASTYFQEMVNELLNLRWLFFIILFLLSLEWFLIKYWGIY